MFSFGERVLRRSVFGVVLLGFIVGSASANGWMYFTNKDNGENAKIKGTYNSTAYGGSSGLSCFAGQLKVKYSDSQSGPWTSEFATYCISPDRALLGTPAQNPWDISTPSLYTAVVGGTSTYDQVAR